jgi:hypothetical protein
MNDIEIEADEDGLAEITLAVATGNVEKSQVAEFFCRLAGDSGAR